MPGETPFRLVLLILFVVQTTISLDCLRLARAAGPLFGHRQARWPLTASIVLSYIAYSVCVVVYLIEPTWMAWSMWPLPVWARWTAVVPLVSGGALVVGGLRNIGTNLTISPSTKEGQRLVTSGTYGWVRHPMYSGVFLQSVGVCLLMANWFVLLCAGTFCSLIAVRTRLEEANLIAKFGDEYRRYQQRVGKFLPKVSLPDQPLPPRQFTVLLYFVSLLTYVVLAAILLGVQETDKERTTEARPTRRRSSLSGGPGCGLCR
jgi:protein-S-isoprenylcysteine O-methyltransferase Ste14